MHILTQTTLMQARIRSHANWQNDTQERMRKTFYAAPEERHAMQCVSADSVKSCTAVCSVRRIGQGHLQHDPLSWIVLEASSGSAFWPV